VDRGMILVVGVVCVCIAWGVGWMI
jgi:hypothetical protein